MSNVGFRVLPSPPSPPRGLVDALRSISTAHLSDNMNRLNSIGAEIRPYHRKGALAGPALTVKVPAGDNLMVHKAIDMARKGDVIVVDAGGQTAHAIIGEIMSALADSRGVCGMVIDGAIRDSDALAQLDFPVYARGITHRGPYKNGPGEINVPISVAGTVINPGDIIVGDEDGLVMVPVAEAASLIELARGYAAKEYEILEAIRGGKDIDRAWVDETLKANGCAF